VAGYFSNVLGGLRSRLAPARPIAGQSEDESKPATDAPITEHASSREAEVPAKGTAAAELGDPDPENFDFDEEWYLREYPDVAHAVREGRGPSGRSHYISHGRSEGRLPGPPPRATGGTDGVDG
jgi:hypothetical protein